MFNVVHLYHKYILWLVICIAKNFIWATLKMIFSIFRFFCILRFQIYKYCPIITNHTLMKRWFIHKSNCPKMKPYDWFCGPGSRMVSDRLIYHSGRLIGRYLIILRIYFYLLSYESFFSMFSKLYYDLND